MVRQFFTVIAFLAAFGLALYADFRYQFRNILQSYIISLSCSFSLGKVLCI